MKRNQIVVFFVVAIITGTAKQTLSEPNLSGFYVFITTPARIMVIAPDGKRLGFDKSTWQELSEIPSGQARMEEKIGDDSDDSIENVSTGTPVNTAYVPEYTGYETTIDDPIPGIYYIEVVASPVQNYILDVRGFSRRAEQNGYILRSSLKLNEHHIYAFKFNPESSQKPLEMCTISDPTGDGLVDCKDIQRVKASLGAKYGELEYDSRVDVIQDGVVDIQDLQFIYQELSHGNTCSE
jgi:hypothetical protein